VRCTQAGLAGACYRPVPSPKGTNKVTPLVYLARSTIAATSVGLGTMAAASLCLLDCIALACPSDLCVVSCRVVVGCVVQNTAVLVSKWSDVLAGIFACFPAIFLTTMVSLWISQGEAMPTGSLSLLPLVGVKNNLPI
jgi:hypothetical protein